MPSFWATCRYVSISGLYREFSRIHVIVESCFAVIRAADDLLIFHCLMVKVYHERQMFAMKDEGRPYKTNICHGRFIYTMEGEYDVVKGNLVAVKGHLVIVRDRYVRRKRGVCAVGGKYVL